EDSELFFNRLFALFRNSVTRLFVPAAVWGARGQWGRSLSLDVSCLTRQASVGVAFSPQPIDLERSLSTRSMRWHRPVRFGNLLARGMSLAFAHGCSRRGEALVGLTNPLFCLPVFTPMGPPV